MSSIFSSLISATNTLSAFQRSLETTGNNVNNASTPGYAKQTQIMLSARFQPEAGLSGGVITGGLASARDPYTEQLVRDRQQATGRAEQLEATMSQLEGLFSASGDSGIPSALNKLFNAFSNLSMAPNDTSARQNVIQQAQALAHSVRDTAVGLDKESQSINTQTQGAVGTINRLARQLRDLNAKLQEDSRNSSDPGLDAQIHATLEELSQSVDIQVLREDDGSFTVLMGGQTPLVMGDHQYEISADSSTGRTKILDAAGNDVTGQISGGTLSGLLELKNNLISGWRGQLDALAGFVAGTVNDQLAAGVDSAGLPGAAMFTYDPVNISGTFAATGITAGEIAAASADAPGGNGNALLLAALPNTALRNGANMMAQYSALAADFGGKLAVATAGQQTARDLLTQVHSLREKQSGVSLDEEAAKLVEVQRSYQAAAKLVTVLDDLTQTCLSILR